MTRICKAFIAFTALTLVLAIIAGCHKSAPADYHIAIVSKGFDYAEDELRGIEELIAQYDTVQNGGKIQWVIYPINLASNQEAFISTIAELADDPLMKAVIVPSDIKGTAAGFQKIKDSGRDDILLMVNQSRAGHTPPPDDLNLLTKVADVIVAPDNVLRSYYDIIRAKNMGAAAFVYISSGVQMAVETNARRKAIYEQACKDFSMEFVLVDVPNPATNALGTAEIQQQVYDMMPGLIEKYGKDAVYFTTPTFLHEPIIRRVAEFGAMFVAQNIMSPSIGYPDVLGLGISPEAGDWWAVTKTIEEDIVAKGASGRMGAWPYSYIHCCTVGLFELAVDMIEGRGTGNIKNDLLTAFQATSGCEWLALRYMDANDKEMGNYFLLSMDTYLFGQGFSGVLSEPFPEKYYSIK